MVKSNPHGVIVERTSMFDHDPIARSVGDMMAANWNVTFNFVGPDPYTKRVFYGSIVIKDGKATVK